MLIHQDASRHEWLAGQLWDLVVTMDDATGEHYSMFFVEEEGTSSSFRGVHEARARPGDLFVLAQSFSVRSIHAACVSSAASPEGDGTT